MPRGRKWSSILWGVFFFAGALAAMVGIAMANHDAWDATDWIGRLVGTAILLAAGAGSLLPDLDLKKDGNDLSRTITAESDDLPGYQTTFAASTVTALAVSGLSRQDPTAAHVLFHTSQGSVVSLRFTLVRLAHDRYAAAWTPIAQESMLEELVQRTNQDPIGYCFARIGSSLRA